MAFTVKSVAKEIAQEIGENYDMFSVSRTFNRRVVRAVQHIYSIEAWPFSRSEDTLSIIKDDSDYLLDTDTLELKSARLDAHRGALTIFSSIDYLVKEAVDFKATGRPRCLYIKGRDETAGAAFTYNIGVWPFLEPRAGILIHARVGARKTGRGDQHLLPLVRDEFVLEVGRRLDRVLAFFEPGDARLSERGTLDRSRRWSALDQADRTQRGD